MTAPRPGTGTRLRAALRRLSRPNVPTANQGYPRTRTEAHRAAEGVSW